jgi:hypothetical protein
VPPTSMTNTFIDPSLSWLVVASAALLREHALRRYVALPFRGTLIPLSLKRSIFLRIWRELADPSSRPPRAESVTALKVLSLFGRSERIRTSDPIVPNDVRYQAALHSDMAGPIRPAGLPYRGAGHAAQASRLRVASCLRRTARRLCYLDRSRTGLQTWGAIEFGRRKGKRRPAALRATRSRGSRMTFRLKPLALAAALIASVCQAGATISRARRRRRGPGHGQRPHPPSRQDGWLTAYKAACSASACSPRASRSRRSQAGRAPWSSSSQRLRLLSSAVGYSSA